MKNIFTKILLISAISISLNAEVKTTKNEFSILKNKIKDCPKNNTFTTKNHDLFTICNKNDETYKITFEGYKHDILVTRPINCNDKKSKGYKIIEHAIHTGNIDGYIKYIYSCISENKIFFEIEDNRFSKNI